MKIKKQEFIIYSFDCDYCGGMVEVIHPVHTYCCEHCSEHYDLNKEEIEYLKSEYK